ncbi:MAG: YraN family protein [Actinomycetales bacterium]|nr:YraN family protein [Actinomycetales bacterium]
MRRTAALGRYGEDVAAAHLQAAGMVVVARNWRCDAGEVDIVATDGSTLVICEVKTRSGVHFGTPTEAITPRKLRRLRHLAFRWLEANGRHAPLVRIDVIGVVQAPTGAPVVEHLRGVG